MNKKQVQIHEVFERTGASVASALEPEFGQNSRYLSFSISVLDPSYDIRKDFKTTRLDLPSVAFPYDIIAVA